MFSILLLLRYATSHPALWQCHFVLTSHPFSSLEIINVPAHIIAQANHVCLSVNEHHATRPASDGTYQESGPANFEELDPRQLP